MGLHGVHEVAREQQLQRLRRAHEARQEVRATVPRNQADADVASENRAERAAKRMSHMRDMSMPAPTAAPLTAAITGLSNSSRA